MGSQGYGLGWAQGTMYRVGQKTGPQTHDHNSVKSSSIKEIFSLEDSLVNLLLNGYEQSQQQPHLAYVATLPRET